MYMKGKTELGRKLRLGTCMSICATITAIAALILSVKQSYEEQLHHRLTLKPFLALNSKNGHDSKIRNIKLGNFGVGPAHIDRFPLMIDNTPVTVAPNEDVWDRS